MEKIITSALEVNDFTLYEILSEAFNRQGDIENLKIIYRQMVKLRPQDDSYILKLSQHYRKAGEYEASINIMKELCKTMPAGNLMLMELAEAYYGHGAYCRENKRYDEAVEALKKAIYSASWAEVTKETIEKVKNFFTSRKLQTITPLAGRKFYKDELTKILRKVTTNQKEINLI